RNGYALPPGIQEGDEAIVLGTVPAERTAPGGTDDSAGGAAGGGWRVWRVETGAFLPDGTDRVLPVSQGVIVGSGKIRLLKLPGEGHGISSGRMRQAFSYAKGSRLNARLRSLAVASGVRAISLRPAFSVGFATVGDELIDLLSPSVSS